MCQFVHLTLLLFLVSVTWSVELPGRQNTADFNDLSLSGKPRQSTQCGGHVVRAQTGQVSYKDEEVVENNERCVWIIRVDNATGYVLNVLEVGSPPEGEPDQEQGVVLSCVFHSNDAVHRVVNTTGTITLEACNVLLVTFYSGPTSKGGSGFFLQYATLFDGVSKEVSIRSMDYYITSTDYYVRHPEFTETYLNNELSIFVFPPYNNTYSSTESNTILFILEELQPSCFDNLRVYNFSPGSQSKWERETLICGHDKTTLMTASDLKLIVFDSDTSVTGAGFHFAVTERCSRTI